MLNAADFAAIGLSLQLAACTTLLLLLVCTPLAWWLATTASRFRSLVNALVLLPLVLPPTVMKMVWIVVGLLARGVLQGWVKMVWVVVRGVEGNGVMVHECASCVSEDRCCQCSVYHIVNS